MRMTQVTEILARNTSKGDNRHAIVDAAVADLEQRVTIMEDKFLALEKIVRAMEGIVHTGKFI